MLNKRKNQKAFTLVELLIVITVISILTTVFISSYKGYIEHARVEASATEIKSVMESLKFKSDSGVTNQSDSDKMSENIAKCQAINFDKKLNIITTFTAKYDNEKESCVQDQDKIENINKVETNNDVEITKLADEGTSNLTIYFLPPRGKIEIYSSDEKMNSFDVLEIQIASKRYTKYSKSISIDPITSIINIL